MGPILTKPDGTVVKCGTGLNVPIIASILGTDAVFSHRGIGSSSLIQCQEEEEEACKSWQTAHHSSRCQQSELQTPRRTALQTFKPHATLSHRHSIIWYNSVTIFSCHSRCHYVIFYVFTLNGCRVITFFASQSAESAMSAEATALRTSVIGSMQPNLRHLPNQLNLRTRGRVTRRFPPARLVQRSKRFLNHLLQNLHELQRGEGGVRRRSGDVLLLSNTHNVFTHFPKDPNCPICQKGKAIKARCSRKSGDSEKPDSLPKPTAFGQMISADHAIFNEDFASRKHDTVALVVQDAFTYWLQAYPAKRKTADECYIAFRRFMGVGKEAGHCWSDGSEELKASLNRLQWPHDSSTPNRPATNGIIERAMQRTKEGTSVCLVQSGLDDQWWDLAMQCYCFSEERRR